MSQDLKKQAADALEAAVVRCEKLEVSLASARRQRPSAASVIDRFRTYVEARAVSFAAWLDESVLLAGDRLDLDVRDVLMGRSGGTDSDAMSYLFRDELMDAITERAKKLFPSGGPSIAEKRGLIQRLESELADAQRALSDAESALEMLEKRSPVSFLP